MNYERLVKQRCPDALCIATTSGHRVELGVSTMSRFGCMVTKVDTLTDTIDDAWGIVARYLGIVED